MRARLIMGACLTFAWACGEPAGLEECENACECWAALNQCIEIVADDVRWDDDLDAQERFVRSGELDFVRQSVGVPREPTEDDLTQCRRNRNSQLLTIRNYRFTELERCEFSTSWAPRYVD